MNSRALSDHNLHHRRSTARVCWRRLDGAGFETATLCQEKSGWVIRGSIARAVAEVEVEVEYTVVCDFQWRTKTTKIICSEGIENRTLDLRNENGFWFKDGKRYPAIDGCTDVDLEWSPSTNTLPIRRLNIPVGGNSGPIAAAWVRFPQLVVDVLPQTYERLAECTYLYCSHGGAFQAAVAVDKDGLVVDYEGLWERDTPLV